MTSLPTSPIWTLPAESRVTIFCAELPIEDRPPYADPTQENHLELARYADLDALFRVQGQLYRHNPKCDIVVKAAREMSPDDFDTHVVVLGGVAWNPATAWVQDLLQLPVRQLVDENDAFCAESNGTRRIFESQAELNGNGLTGTDVALFARAPNPYSAHGTITICNGVRTPGVVGAVEVFTNDAVVRENLKAVDGRVDSEHFGVVFTVDIVGSKAITPRLEDDGRILYTW